VAGWNSGTVRLTALGLLVMTCGGACTSALDDGGATASARTVEVCRDEVRGRLEYPDLAAFSTIVHVRRIGHHWFVRSSFEPERTADERPFTCEVDGRNGRRAVHLRFGG